MKKLLKEFLGDDKPLVHVFMKDDKIYEKMRIEKLSETAFRGRIEGGPVYIIQYDEVKLIKCMNP